MYILNRVKCYVCCRGQQAGTAARRKTTLQNLASFKRLQWHDSEAIARDWAWLEKVKWLITLFQTAQKPEEAVAVQLCYLPDNLAEKFTVWASLHLLTYYQMPKNNSWMGKLFYKGKGKTVAAIVELWIIWIVATKFVDPSDGKGFLGC